VVGCLSPHFKIFAQLRSNYKPFSFDPVRFNLFSNWIHWLQSAGI